MDANLATTYTLIHSFLRKHSHTKAALAVKKAAKDIVVLKDDIEIEGPCLDTILMEWKAAQAVAATKSSSPNSSYNSDSEDSSSSSDSDSSDSSDSSDTSSTSETSPSKSNLAKGKGSKLAKADEQVKTKVVPKAASSLGESSSESSDSDSSPSSSTDSDDESSECDTKMSNSKHTQKPIKTTAGLKPKVERQSSQTLTSGSSSISSASEDASGRETLKGDKTKTADNNDSSDSESFSSDSENDASVKSKCVKKSKTNKPKKTKRPSSSSSSSSDSDSSTDEDKAEIVKLNKKHTTSGGGDETPAQATKKRRITEDGAAVVTATTESVEPPQSGLHSSGRIKANGKPARKTNTPFQRVNPEKVDQQVLLQNNGYMAKAAPANDYGARAHQDLIVTRGAGFRKEKNKKKRGSYKGGTISLESHSFKFT